MGTPDFHHLEIEQDAGTTTVWLNRPDVRNAFDAQLIEDLTRCFTWLSDDPDTRVVVLAGRGKAFCAGADINWMRDSAEYSRQQNVDDATRMARMLGSIASCSKPVITRVHGMAIGGGLGLIAASDYTVAEADTAFAFSEVKLGILPAAISPFVLARIGAGHARPLFITGERFGTERAFAIGLVHLVREGDALDAEVDRITGELHTAAPEAIAICKRLMEEINWTSYREAMAQTVETIATKRTDPEGQEGLTAFLEKRRPAWMDEAHAPAWVGSR